MRAYQAGDKTGCLAVFDSNLPDYFSQEERPRFTEFLETGGVTFWVMEHDGSLVGCGGYQLDGADVATLRWTMVRRDLHRNGLGRFLLFALMRKLSSEGDPTLMRLETMPLAAPFFERQGFRPAGAAGARIEMVKKLKVCN